ncbi:TetR/AcrR family transcriptional regulator [Erysipelothrix sp. HDW6C]|uniref:TetR/AcrR family transcriptional regulator n=1 Tax=Erysipelothrix sp. HDW6C TaxID=2714930 RepID=UPI00140D55B4|nr:TetR/AcrR family transcriptional regulator [Erysipelothrix sp. HDW6C]QIK69759.1 TetR/AcrR family transcriptional regulator [Erysipelothrix sp. HDW6C]
MKKAPITKEHLIDIARKIVLEEGLDALSMRRVAKEANVALGSVYNYFDSKSDLVFTLVDIFWDTLFIKNIQAFENESDYPGMLRHTYERIIYNAHIYHSIFAGYYRALSVSDREESRRVHEQQLQRINTIFLKVLNNDPRVRPSIWSDTFTKDEFNRFVVRNLLESLRHGSKNIDFLIELVQLTLYGQREA